MDELIDEFLAETRDMLQALSGAIVAWEAEPGDRARLDEIFRFVHTVKGNCGFFDLPRLQQLSHRAEDALADVRAGRRTADARLVSAVLAVIDRIGELVQALESGEALASDDDELLIAALGAEPVAAPAAADAPAGEEAAPAAEARKAVRSIRLSVDLLDRMMNGVSDAVLARNELARRLRESPGDLGVEAAFDRVSACIAEIRDAITRTRMQRIDSLFAALPRMVRDLSAELGKPVRLEVDGGDVELDREMIEMIRDPLTHIVRNAIDHGIEPADARRAAGKAPHGTLRVAARQAGNQILIEVADDGRGIDGERLVRKAIAAGMIDAARADALSPAQRHALIFEPGLSTAGEVTAISGRGVGMDVVRANIERIGGVVELDSRKGQGVRLTIRVPLTLTIIPALTVSASGQIFAIPRAAIEEIVRLSAGAVQVDEIGEARVAAIRGRRVPLIALGDLMKMPSEGGEVMVLLKPAGAELFALLLDAVHDHEELVVKPAAPAVMAAGLYAGTTLADDGKPILLLDPAGIAAAAGLRGDVDGIERRLQAPADPAAGAAGEEAPELPLLLFTTLEGTRRAVRLSAVERIEDVAAEAVGFAAGRLRVTLNGRILPLAGCAAPPEGGKLRVLRLSDGSNELGYAFAEVIDIRTIAARPVPAPVPGEVAGALLVDGAQVELLDPYWLFASLGGGGEVPERRDAAARPVCALPPDDPWMDTMLRPLIESLGYTVVAAGEGVAADIRVAAEDAPDGGGPLLRLRARPEPAHANDDSIYRYDRAALVRALSRDTATGTDHG
jgi:two-component system, chemotaxis family, sensor kinase CheA